MTSAAQLHPHLFSTVHPFPSVAPEDVALELNATACTVWEQTHHLLFHLGNLSLLLGLLIPTTLDLHMIVLRLLLMTGQYCILPNFVFVKLLCVSSYFTVDNIKIWILKMIRESSFTLQNAFAFTKAP